MMNVHEVADCLRHFYNAAGNDPLMQRARSRRDFERLLRAGYFSYSVRNNAPMRVVTFRRMTSLGTWNELDQAASRFASICSRPRPSDVANKRLGARDMLGVTWRMARLDQRIRGQGLTPYHEPGHPVPAPSNTGFSLTSYQRTTTRVAAGSWRDVGLQTVDSQDFANVHRTWKTYHRTTIRHAHTLYCAAIEGQQLAPAVATPFLGHLRTSPWDIWEAYKAAQYPALRATGERLAMVILAGHDPYSDAPVPPTAYQNYAGTFVQGLAQPFSR